MLKTKRMKANARLNKLSRWAGIGLVAILMGCGGQEYADGTYCAEVNYHKPRTGTRSTYTLEVDVASGELTQIHWPNSGWLDESHFSPPDISGGEASFTSDEGVDYAVRIIGDQGDCTFGR